MADQDFFSNIPSAKHGDADFFSHIEAPKSSTPGGWFGREAAGLGAAAGESFGDTMLGAQELIGHALHASGFEGAGQWLIDDAQRGAKKLKSEAEPYRKAAPSGAFVGDIVGQAPLALGVGEIGLASKVGEAALSGAASGALQPTSGTGNFAAEKAKQVGVGAALGGVAGAAGKGVSAAIAPKLGADQAALAARGVQMTPGQMAGGYGKALEDMATTVPVASAFIKSGQRESIETFNRAVINDALDPIGEKLPAKIEMGRPAVEAAQTKIADAYNALLPKMRFVADRQFVADLANLRGLTAYMPPDQVAQFQKILTERVAKRLSPLGTMDGETMKQVESELGNFAASYRGSADAAQRQLGDAVREMQNLLRQNLQRQNPKYAKDLQSINDAYARLVRVEGAADRRATSGGVFTPGDLLGAIKSADKTTRKKAFAGGNALGQDFAESAQRVLPQKVPSSGTSERLALTGILGDGAFHYPEAAAGAAALSLPYTGPAIAGLNRLAQPAGPARQTAADLAQQLGVYAAPAVASDAARP